MPQSNGKKQDVLKNIFDAGISEKFEMGAFEDFPRAMTESQTRVNLFQALSQTHDLGTFDDFEDTIKPLLPKTGIAKAVGAVGDVIGQVFAHPSEEQMAAGRALKKQQDEQEVRDRILPINLRAPALKKILDEPESLHALSFEEIMNMAPMLGITRGDMFEALGPTLDKDNVLGFIKNALTGMANPAMERDEDKFSAIFDKSLTNFEAMMPDEPPEGFMQGPFTGLTEQGQKKMWLTAQGMARWGDAFATPRNIMLMGAVGATVKTSELMAVAIPALFSADMISQNPAMVRAIVQAFKEGDPDEGHKLIVGAVLTNLLAGALGLETFRRIKSGKNIISPASKPIWDELRAALEDPKVIGDWEASIERVSKWTKNNERQLARIAQALDEKVISKEGVDVTERAAAIEKAVDALNLKKGLIMKGALLKENRAPVEGRAVNANEVIATEIGIRRVRGKDVTESKPINDPQTKFESDVETVKVVADNTTNIKVKEKVTELAKEGEGLKNIDEVQVRFEEFLKEKQIGREADLKAVRNKISVGKGVPKGSVISVENASVFLSKKFPRLFESVNKIELIESKQFIKDVDSRAQAVVEITGSNIELKIKGNLITEQSLELPKKSPQIELESNVKPSVFRTELSETQAVRLLSHELRHALDERTFGSEITLAMDEVGKILGRTDLQAKAERIKERGIKPQRYRVMLSERRARAQERTVLKSLREGMRESIRGFLELLGGDPSLLSSAPFLLPPFTEKMYLDAKPHFELAWKKYKDAGAGLEFPDFVKTMTEELGPHAIDFMKRFKVDFDAAGIIVDRKDIKDIEVEHPQFAEPDPSSLPPDTPIDIRLDAYKDARERIRAHGKKWNEFIVDVLSVEARGRRIGAPETVLAMKNFFGEEFRHQDQANYNAAHMVAALRRTSKDFRFKPDKPALQEVAMFMENVEGMSPAQSKRYRGILNAWTQYKQFAIDIYKRHGELPNFTKHVNAAIMVEKFKRAGENTADIDAVAEVVGKIKPASFEASLFLENFIRNTPDEAASFYLGLLEEGRGGRIVPKISSLSLKDIIEHGVSPDQINAVDLIGGLGRRLGQDSAILNVRSAAIKEGLAKRFKSGKDVGITESPFARSDARYFEDYVTHPILNEWLGRMTRPGWKAFDIISQGVSTVKMASFYNPLFLPMYDIFQSGMLGSLKPHLTGAGIGGAIGGIPGAALGFVAGEAVTLTLAKGFYHALAKTPLYFHALSGGLSSKPFPNHLHTFRDAQVHLKESLAPVKGQLWAAAISNGVELSKAVVGLEAWKRYQQGERAWKLFNGLPPQQVLKQAYNLSHGIAWQLDRGVRMANYIWLRQGKGFKEIKFGEKRPIKGKLRDAMGHMEAAQTAALFNADYASVPAPTRKILNLGLYTPTFKIAMGKLYFNMISSAIKGIGRGTDLALGGIFNTSKMTKKEKVQAWGLLNTAAIGMGFHLYMISQGFKTEIPFVKYKRPTVTGEGPQDIVSNYSNPGNLWIKYAFRIYNSLFRASPTPELKRLVNSFKWEFTPLLRIAGNMADNMDDSGDAIVLTTDTKFQGRMKLLKYALLNGAAMAKLVEPDRRTVEARTALANEMGQLFAIATAPFVFSYLKDIDSEVATSQINQMQTSFTNDIRDGRISFEDIDSHTLVLMDKINDILEQRGLIRQP